jgi:exopolyphosphatase/guanosine-5'-triphosphate,3'-diphosphate pyrophosphatase
VVGQDEVGKTIRPPGRACVLAFPGDSEHEGGVYVAAMPRIAVVDIGTNSTRLLVAEVEHGAVAEVARRTVVTRLGEGVDATGRLSEAAVARVEETLGGYREVIDQLTAERVVGVATSAVRDAQNGPAFCDRVRSRFGIDLQTISGDREARLTFRGATAGHTDVRETVVIDIGGGSTEYVIGRPGADPGFRASARMGSVRHTERFIAHDPPKHPEVAELSADAGRLVRAEIPRHLRRRTERGIAVAGTATSLAAVDQALDPYDPAKVHGYRLALASCERILSMLAALPLDARRRVRGLHPDRAPTIVAGAVILLASLRAFRLEEVEVSEHDILHGTALAAAGKRLRNDRE